MKLSEIFEGTMSADKIAAEEKDIAVERESAQRINDPKQHKKAIDKVNARQAALDQAKEAIKTPAQKQKEEIGAKTQKAEVHSKRVGTIATKLKTALSNLKHWGGQDDEKKSGGLSDKEKGMNRNANAVRMLIRDYENISGEYKGPGSEFKGKSTAEIKAAFGGK